jgi:hypothetical protein
MRNEIKYNKLVINNSLRIKITNVTQNNFNKIKRESIKCEYGNALLAYTLRHKYQSQ